jgi:hypothetical protein
MQPSKSDEERDVALGVVPDTKEGRVDLMKQQPSFKNVGDAVPKFKKVSDYTNFLAEYALINGNVVVHFFETPERPWQDTGYWRKLFPAVLDEQGQLHFQGTFPRLKARLTEEMRSWWFEAQNYTHIIDLDDYMGRFFHRLDRQLDATEAQQ